MVPPDPPPDFLPAQGLPPSVPLESSLSDLIDHEPKAPPKPNPRRFLSRVFLGTLSAAEWLFGLGALVVILSVLAALPILQFLSLGYMLESAARVARSGKIREGFIGIRTLARFGAAVASSWLMLLPLRYLSDVAFTAQIINPAGGIAARLRFVVLILTMLVGCQIVFAIARGGRIRHFFWPLNFLIVYRNIRKGEAFTRSRDATLAFLGSLRLPHYFSLGFRGFIGVFLWLMVPVSLLAFGQAKTPIAPLFGFLGAFLLAIVVLHLPLLQTQMAVENRFRTIFDWRQARKAYTHAPWAISFALLVTLAFALPLYLLKIEVVPQEALWLPTLVFILFIFPARLITGWAVGRSLRRETPRHWFFRWTGRMPLLPAIAIYLLFVFFSQYTSWNGIGSLYEQHAFLLPVPFFGL
ncbi:MAG: hypothetical protein EXS11_04130 [Gemmataceae bacterium]|nr:hypothetical protein [Gemmataceae bacterium]